MRGPIRCPMTINMRVAALGAQIRERRKELGLTQARLAAMTQLSRASINALESGTTDLGLAKVLKIAEVWFKDASEITFHDPLAAATIFHPGLCAYQQGSVVADPSTGATHFKESARGPTDEVAQSVDSTAFFEEYFSVF